MSDRGRPHADSRYCLGVRRVTGARLEIDGQVGVKQLRFRARLVRDAVQLPGGALEGINGVALTPVLPYRWP